MSLVLGAAITDYIDHGSGAVLDNLPSNGVGFTVWGWFYPTTITAGRMLISKYGLFPSGWFADVQTSGAVRLLVWRAAAATPTESISATGVLTVNTWTFIALTYNDAASPKVRIYAGGLESTVAETAYGTTAAGGGTPDADAAYNLYVGAYQETLDGAFTGSIARAGVVNRALTLGELAAIQFGNVAQANVSGTVLLASYADTGTQPDYSGNGNNGTISGATVGAGLPLGSWFGADEQPYAISVQSARPSADSAAGTWTTDAGAATGLFGRVNEALPDDANYIQSVAAPSAAVVALTLPAITDPVTSVGHNLRFRFRRNPEWSKATTLTVRLMEGASVRATTTVDCTEEWITVEYTLSGAEADSIVSYSALALQFAATQL